MKTMDAILARRSVRKYTAGTVGEDVIDDILKAAMSAPSAGNEQPWHFIVVRDRDLLDRVPEHHPHSHCVTQVQVAILVCGDLGLEKYEGFWVQDCAAAAQNILLAARSLGLGTVWLGIYPIEERVVGIKGLFGLPESVIPLCIIPIGQTDKPGSPVERFDRSRVHFDRW